MANWNSLIKQCMKDNFIKERNLEKVKWHTHLEIVIKVFGKMIWKQDKELWFGIQLIRNILENGIIINKMVLVHMFGLIIWVNIACLETDMKVSGLIVDVKE
jgi:hypothetical protein